ncbi:lactonase family protein [Pontibacter sp. Tf4]|uniref:lactonase family protein n=1 Tax=Pontibacter sp. Tf4 TaxID=2761620 RepID=UPI001629744A|nr:lactonase family protein [Pontibacter sp. Tf4]MBB6613176.1 lactonase family protein [Pontibacter sp. Tf4]
MPRQKKNGNYRWEDPESLLVYVGTYAPAHRNSIFLYRLNQQTGQLTRIKGFKGGEKPSYMVFDAQHRYMYAVNEQENYRGKSSGAVCAFAVNRETGNLTFLNRTPSLGSLPVYITLSRTGKSALVANYKSGTISVLPVQENGKLAKASEQIRHHGAGPDPNRQESAHVHCITCSPDGRFVFVVDLGNDSIMQYKLHADEQHLLPGKLVATFKTEPGSGPRQLRFHPGGRFAYLIHELSSVISALTYNPEAGTFTEIQTIATITAEYHQENKCGGIRITSDGRFLYGSNRGHNSLAVFAIDETSGKLTHLENTPSGGAWPREFTIAGNGNFLLAANQHSGTIVSFRIDRHTGKLTHSGYQAELEKPVFIGTIEYMN